MKKNNKFELFVVIAFIINVLFIYFFRNEELGRFATILSSIILEAFPFILLGTIISSIIQVFVTDETIKKLLPDSMFKGIVVSSLIGFVFPVCECAIIPIARRLIKKGLPVPMAVTFLLSTPITNPIVIFSTYYAFGGDYKYVLLRLMFGMLISILVGLGIHLFVKESVFKTFYVGSLNKEKKNVRFFDSVYEVLKHTSLEFYDIGRFLIFGAVISANINTFVSKSFMNSLGSNNISSILAMMALAFILSICSEADAFIASSFRNIFSRNSILAFLVFGPMLDIKNSIMLFGSFKSKFVYKLIGLTISITFLVFYVASMLGV